MIWDEYLETFLDELSKDRQIQLDKTDEQILKILFSTKRWSQVSQSDVCQRLEEFNKVDTSVKVLGIPGLEKRLGAIYTKLEEKFSIGLTGKQNKAKKLHDWLLTRFQEPHSNNTSEKIARLLLSLDYQPHEGDFTQIRLRLNYFGAFIFGSTAYRTQRWLVSRLARQFPGYQDAIKIPIKVNSHLMQSDFSEFLQEISIKINLSLPVNDDDECINILHENYTSTSLIIGLYGVNKLSQPVVQRFLNFWQKYYTKMESEKSHNLDKLGIFIFMSHDIDPSINILEARLPPMFDNNDFIRKLADIPIISLEDIEGWLKEKARNKELEKQIVQHIIDERLQRFNHGNNHELFDDICAALKNDILSVEKYWELSK